MRGTAGRAAQHHKARRHGKSWHRPEGKGLSAPRKVADSMEKKHADVAWTPGA
jgi:hypothetical protein